MEKQTAITSTSLKLPKPDSFSVAHGADRVGFWSSEASQLPTIGGYIKQIADPIHQLAPLVGVEDETSEANFEACINAIATQLIGLGQSVQIQQEMGRTRVFEHLVKTPNGSNVKLMTGHYDPERQPFWIGKRAYDFRYDCHNNALGCWQDYLVAAGSMWDVLHDNTVATTVIAHEPAVIPNSGGQLENQTDDIEHAKQGSGLFQQKISANQVPSPGDILVFWSQGEIENSTGKDIKYIMATHTVKIETPVLIDSMIHAATLVDTKNGCEVPWESTLNDLFSDYPLFKNGHYNGDYWAGIYRLK